MGTVIGNRVETHRDLPHASKSGDYCIAVIGIGDFEIDWYFAPVPSPTCLYGPNVQLRLRYWLTGLYFCLLATISTPQFDCNYIPCLTQS